MTTNPLIEKMAEAIHDAKIRSCWMKAAWDERRAKEPWEKPNSAAPDQPWHDISRDQAKAAYAAIEPEINKLETENRRLKSLLSVFCNRYPVLPLKFLKKRDMTQWKHRACADLHEAYEDARAELTGKDTA